MAITQRYLIYFQKIRLLFIYTNNFLTTSNRRIYDIFPQSEVL